MLAPTFLAEAMRRLRDGVGGVGGVFTGRSGGGFVGMLQRNEYARYARDVARLKGKVLVLTGTATLFSARTLRHVVWARAEGLLPGGSAQVYDTNVLTEDNELTLALLHLGYKVISPKGCRLTTEVMTTWRDLYRQRLRWKRGAIENLRDYGLTRVTARYWGRQLFTFVGIVVTLAYLFTLGWSLALHGSIDPRPLWLAVTGIFVVERVVTVRARGSGADGARGDAARRDELRHLPPGNPSTSHLGCAHEQRKEVVMYGNSLFATGAGAVVGTLPFTGLNLAWSGVAAFALLMAAGALWRIVPRSQG